MSLRRQPFQPITVHVRSRTTSVCSRSRSPLRKARSAFCGSHEPDIGIHTN